jgi:hypothetical protein
MTPGFTAEASVYPARTAFNRKPDYRGNSIGTNTNRIIPQAVEDWVACKNAIDGCYDRAWSKYSECYGGCQAELDTESRIACVNKCSAIHDRDMGKCLMGEDEGIQYGCRRANLIVIGPCIDETQRICFLIPFGSGGCFTQPCDAYSFPGIYF